MKTTPLIRRAGICGLVVMAALGAVAHNTTAAHADEVPEYTTVLWSMPAGVTTWPQTYVDQIDGYDVRFSEDVGSAILCGTSYQEDTYKTSDVAGLIADKTLTEGEDYGKAIVWHTFTTPECETEPSPEPTPTETATPPVTPPTTTTPSPSTEPTAPPATPTSTPVAPTTPPSVSAVPSASVAASTPDETATAASLAFTGSRDMTPLKIAACLLLAAGIALVARAAVLRRRQQ